jgi:hypothetical protein
MAWLDTKNIGAIMRGNSMGRRSSNGVWIFIAKSFAVKVAYFLKGQIFKTGRKEAMSGNFFGVVDRQVVFNHCK